jgi:four helix bundle protein
VSTTIRSYRDLVVWQLGMNLVRSIYELTGPFPRDELFGLTSQLRRAAISVPSNIAEGDARDSRKEYLHHLSISLGSLAEVETQLLLASQLGYCPRETIDRVLMETNELGRKLRGLQKSLKAKV